MNGFQNKVKRIFFYISKLGLYKFCIFTISKFYKFRIKNSKIYLDLFRNKSGIELGGPSSIFCSSNILPIYDAIKELDSINFSKVTMWEGEIDEDKAFAYNEGTKSGRQYILDGVDLYSIEDKKYDFAISSNAIEHFANPLKALKELLRITKDEGLILLVLPNKLINFDNKRNTTNFNKIKEIYNNKIGEDSLESLDEILSLHDFLLDPLAINKEHFLKRSQENYTHRGLHHHVYNIDLLKEIFNYLNIKIINTHSTIEDHIILGRKI